jgi:hypothetical protein
MTAPRCPPRKRRRRALLASAVLATAVAAATATAGPQVAAADTGTLASMLGTAVARSVHRAAADADDDGGGGGGIVDSGPAPMMGLGLPEWDGLAEAASATFSDVVLLDSPLADFVTARVVRGINGGNGSGSKGYLEATKDRLVEAAERAAKAKAQAAAMELFQAEEARQQGKGEQAQRTARPSPLRAMAAAAAKAEASSSRPVATAPTGYALFGKLQAFSQASGALAAPPEAAGAIDVRCFTRGGGGGALGGGVVSKQQQQQQSQPPRQLCSAPVKPDGRFACHIPAGLAAKAARAGLLDPLFCEASSASGKMRRFVSAPFSAALNATAPLREEDADPLLWALPRAAGTMLPSGWRVAPVRRCAAASPAAVPGSCEALAAAAPPGAPAVANKASAAAAAPVVPPEAAASSSSSSGGFLDWARKAVAKGLAAASSSSSSSSAPAAASKRSSLEMAFDSTCSQHACCVSEAVDDGSTGAPPQWALSARRRRACDVELRDALESACRATSSSNNGGEKAEKVCLGVAANVAAAAARATAAA